MRIPSDGPSRGREALPRPDGAATPPDTKVPTPSVPVREIGGPAGPPSYPDPTRYGDWERNGRCIDF